MTRRELKKMLGIGDVALDRALDEVNAEGRLNKAWTYRRNINGRPYKVEVIWFDDEINDLHKPK
jgi:hypothetical protein